MPALLKALRSVETMFQKKTTSKEPPFENTTVIGFSKHLFSVAQSLFNGQCKSEVAYNKLC